MSHHNEHCPLRRYLREEIKAWGLVVLVCLPVIVAILMD